MSQKLRYILELFFGILGMLFGVLCILSDEAGIGLIFFVGFMIITRKGFIRRRVFKTSLLPLTDKSKQKTHQVVQKKVESIFTEKTAKIQSKDRTKTISLSKQKAPSIAVSKDILPSKFVNVKQTNRKNRHEEPPRAYNLKRPWSPMRKAAVFAAIVAVLCLIGYGLESAVIPQSSQQKSTDFSSSTKTSPIESGKSKCGNGVKDSGETCSTCPSDIKCNTGYICVSDVCQKESYCGDGQINSSETCSNCSQDVKCQTWEECIAGECVEQSIEADFKVYTVTPVSTGVFYYDQDFYETFTQNSWAKVKIEKSGEQTLKNAKLTADFGAWAEDITKILGDITSTKDIYLNPKLTTSALVKQETSQQAKFTLEYYDGQNEKHTVLVSKTVMLLPPQYVSMRITTFSVLYSEKKYQAFLQFYDERIKSLALQLTQAADSMNEARAKAIYDGLAEAGLIYQVDPDTKFDLTYFTSSGEITESTTFDYIKFPYQTYSEKNGDCEDLSILMASLLQSIDINSYLLFTKDEDSAHVFLSFEGDNDNVVRVETTLVGKDSYETAVRRGQEKFEEYRDKWLNTIVVRDVFSEPDVRKLPVW